ncbi:hypothetical protein ACFL96_07195 [Thermoproteota archaeon]
MSVHKKKRHKRHIREHKSFDRFKVMTAVLGILLILSILTGGFTGVSEKRESGRIIFLKPYDCTGTCIEAEDVMKNVAAETGLEFDITVYGQSVMAGYVLIYGHSSIIGGYTDEGSFREKICGFTGIRDACT